MVSSALANTSWPPGPKPMVTAVTAQNTVAVRAIHTIPPDIIAAQLDAVLDDIPIAAVKIGMLANADTIRVVADRLRAHQVRNIVLDPVMVAKSGDHLLQQSAIAALKSELIPLATLLTPNLPEAAQLVPSGDSTAMLAALRQLGAQAVLLKGGHGAGDTIEDLLLVGSEYHSFRHPRLTTPHTHGTGCSLSSAITAGFARGLLVVAAVDEAITWITEAIAHAWPLGAGHGPIHHFWKLWP